MLFGAVLLILPGPGILTILLGFSILATEFYWAKRWRDRIQLRLDKTKSKIMKNKAPDHVPTDTKGNSKL